MIVLIWYSFYSSVTFYMNIMLFHPFAAALLGVLAQVNNKSQ